MSDRVELNRFYFPEGFQRSPGYKDIDKSPKVVCERTHELMDLMLGGVLRGDSSVALDYFGNQTVEYFKAASKGFFALTNHSLNLDKHLLKELYRRWRSSDNNLDMEDREAFGHSLVVLGHMPYSSSLINNMNRFVDTRAPRDIRSYLVRMDEMRWVVDALSAKKISISKVGEGCPDVVRTLVYFETAAELQLRIPTTEAMRIEEERAFVNQLLGGIDFDI